MATSWVEEGPTQAAQHITVPMSPRILKKLKLTKLTLLVCRDVLELMLFNFDKFYTI